ncbi:DUF4253 domain-containing protein [Mycobacterium sp. 134]|uniref:DUF4253 domain-containing protein n=1 Tax=Mycobacterium sp. 134 TaxID=3400425 RepID=UPI003AB000D5
MPLLIRFLAVLTLAMGITACTDSVSAPPLPQVVSSPVQPAVSPLPTDGTTLVGAVALPAGQRIFARDSVGAPTSPPLAWYTEVPTTDVQPLWEALARQFPNTKLWPVVTNGLDGDLDRPWRTGELDPVEDNEPIEPDQWFRDHDITDNPDSLGPAYRGLAAGSSGPPAWHNTNLTRTAPPPYPTTGLLLVAVDRPADVPATLGWTGPMNHALTAAGLSSILRSWEDRFGATLIELDFDTAQLHVPRPPGNEQQCATVAKEHIITAPDIIGPSTFNAYTSQLCRKDTWFLWWD